MVKSFDIGNIHIPTNPGIYMMKSHGNVIYVGKAKNLRNRVLSYFNKSQKDLKTMELIKRIDDIEFISCKNEVDALLLENNKIKELQPKYNILLKDNKTYPYIKITDDEFPTIYLCRTGKINDKDRSIYFGPFTTKGKEIVKQLKKYFKLRDCNRDMTKEYKKPCLKYYLNTCCGPCINKDIKEKYFSNIVIVKELLMGKEKNIINDLKDKIAHATVTLDFEKAIELRDELNFLMNLPVKQTIEQNNKINEDVIVFDVVNERLFFVVLNVVEGKIKNKISKEVNLKNKIYTCIEEEIILSYYNKAIYPNKIILELKNKPKLKDLEELLIKDLKIKVQFLYPKISSKRKELLDFALLNLKEDINRYLSKEDKVNMALEYLKEKLKLKRIPNIIECFDISNIQGKDAVASMSVAINGKKSKQNYRKFKITCKDTPDDFMMMREVIERRYSKIDSDELPNVILIDGGLGQINSAGEILDKLGITDKVDLLSLAKRDEEIYKYGESKPYKLSKDLEALKIFQRVRDEAHRFGIEYHRKVRKNRIISSELDTIKGIGIERKKKLLTRFGSVENIRKQSYEELCEVVPKNVAENIIVQLNKDNI